MGWLDEMVNMCVGRASIPPIGGERVTQEAATMRANDKRDRRARTHGGRPKGYKRKLSETGISPAPSTLNLHADDSEKKDRQHYPSGVVETALEHLNRNREKIESSKILKKSMPSSISAEIVMKSSKDATYKVDFSRAVQDLLLLRKWTHAVAELAKNGMS